MYYETINDKEELDEKIDEYEYYNEIGHYKMKILFFSEKISSIGMFIFVF